MKNTLSRRAFLGRTAKTAALTAIAGAFSVPPARARIVGANDAVNVAVIGTGGMGSRHVEALAKNPNCRLVALCDVGKSRYVRAAEIAKGVSGADIPTYQDFREVLPREDVDAIFIATPDHWHPLLAMLGCEAGKDVYVEKPASPTVAEGRAMVNAARRYGRVMQLGTQQRSMPVFQKAIEVVHSGRIGQVTSASAWVDTNGFGLGENPEPVPKGLDWDLWLGPAPFVPYAPERYFGFMGWHDYARGGQLTNWGVHLMDIVHWGIQQDTPLSIQALGGSYQGGAGADNYETIDAILEYPGVSVTWEQRHSNTQEGKGYGIHFQGTKGELFVDRGSFVVRPNGLGIAEYVGAPELSWANDDHHNNFFHCVRTRQKPAADIEQGHRSTSAVLLAGIALKARRKLFWDGANEKFFNDPAADSYLTRAYRPPWRIPG
ncbi:MAG: Gfo/Idh/MocA family oxidoreductase [Candidatus Hydrogenedentes bacterium]|nr:Gfo/Idh/MocA family oxidoreductase [Candidatus Hydrogenedentota bacterium]